MAGSIRSSGRGRRRSGEVTITPDGPRLRESVEVLVYKVAHVLAIEPEYPASAAAAVVAPEGRHRRDHVAAAEVVRTAGIAEAGAPGRRVVREQQREVSGVPGVDLQQMRFGKHTEPFGDGERGIDSLEAIAHGGKPGRASWLEGIELVLRGKPPVLAGGQIHRAGQDDDPDVVQEEGAFGKLGMRVPLRRLAGVGTRKGGAVVAVLDIGLGEHPHAAELARLPGAVPG